MNFGIVDISLDVCKNSSVTRRETFNNSENPCRLLILLKCELQNCWCFVRRMQKKLREAPRRQTPVMKFRLTCALYKPTRTLMTASLLGNNKTASDVAKKAKSNRLDSGVSRLRRDSNSTVPQPPRWESNRTESAWLWHAMGLEIEWNRNILRAIQRRQQERQLGWG